MIFSRPGPALLLLSLLGGLSARADTLADQVDSATERLVGLGVEATAARQLIVRWQAVAAAPPADSLVQAMTAVVERRRAPLDLVVDKVSEGLAKQVPPEQLLPALDRWGRELSQASEVARRLHNRFDAGAVSMRETVLRVHLLRRGYAADAWLRTLFMSAREADPDVGTFLRVSEAVAQLREQGMAEESAVVVGQRWLAAGVVAGDVPVLVRAIEEARRDTSLSAAAQWVTDRLVEGSSAKEVAQQAARRPSKQDREREDASDVSGDDGGIE